jgi:hypothetical protein
MDNVNQMKNEYAPVIKNLTSQINVQVGGIDNDVSESLQSGINKFSNRTENRMNDFVTLENSRSLTTILIFAFYLIISGLAFFAFFKRKPNLLLFLAILLLFSIPLLLFFQGIVATYYFYYSDTCQAVHDTIYENQFPIDNYGLGYYVSCFDLDTKASLYTYSYQLENVNTEISKQLAGNFTGSKNDLIELQTKIKNAKNDIMSKLISCSHVYQSISFMEERFCAYGMNWSKYLITSYSWLMLIILITSIGINRLKPVVEKKNSEIEVTFLLNYSPCWEMQK